jgi:hypothetical protein
MPDPKAYPTTPSLIPKAVASKKPDAVWQVWQRVVEQYAKRDLTVPSDKLPAISGIASELRKATHSNYLAGLWRDNLASDLLWSASPPVSGSTGYYALETWRAPSFSWASLDIAVTYTQLDEEEREAFTSTITVLATSVTPKGLNPLGSLSDAFITVRGLVSYATLCSEQTGGQWTYTLLIKGTSTMTITHDCLLVETVSQSEVNGRGNSVRRAQVGDNLVNFRAHVLCLSIARYDNIIAGLVLGVSGRNTEACERLGTFAAGAEALRDAEEKELVLL